MRLFVPLSRQEIDILIKLAATQRRRPQDQAAYLLSQSLVRGQASERANQTGAEVAEAVAFPKPNEVAR